MSEQVYILSSDVFKCESKKCRGTGDYYKQIVLLSGGITFLKYMFFFDFYFSFLTFLTSWLIGTKNFIIS